jgi:hypothetical protein
MCEINFNVEDQEIVEVQEIIAKIDVKVGDFDLLKGTKARMVVYKLPISLSNSSIQVFPSKEKVSVKFEITKQIQGNVLIDRDFISRNFETE